MPTLIFGGAFDPPHNEHVKVLECAARTLKAERVVVLPTFCLLTKAKDFWILRRVRNLRA